MSGGFSGTTAFRGAIAFQDRDAAGRLIDLMADFMDQASDVFGIADDDLRSGSALALEAMFQEAVKLCVNFEYSAKSDKYKKMARAGVDAMQRVPILKALK
jgi:hypothetical protein